MNVGQTAVATVTFDERWQTVGYMGIREYFLVVKWQEYEAEIKNAHSYLCFPVYLHGIF
jgi:hypothetical protein